MTTLSIYILFSYLFYIGVFTDEYQNTGLKFFTWREWLAAIFAPLSFPVVLGIYMNEQK
jgi:hypothetical protein